MNRNGATPLSFAAQQRNPDAVCALLDAGADVNAKDREGRTAAFYAQSPEMIRFLAKYEADFFVKDCEGRLPIFSPLISGFIFSSPDYPTALAMLKEMVKQGWDYNSPVGREGDIFRYYQDKEEACKAKEELETLQRTIEADQAAFENDYDGYER